MRGSSNNSSRNTGSSPVSRIIRIPTYSVDDSGRPRSQNGSNGRRPREANGQDASMTQPVTKKNHNIILRVYKLLKEGVDPNYAETYERMARIENELKEIDHHASHH